MNRTMFVCFTALMLLVVRADGGGGGRYVSARPMAAPVGFGQGTPMYASYGPYAGDCCGDCYTACGTCCPGLIPRIVGGIHRVLTGVLCGHRFYDPGCGTCCGSVAMAGDCCDSGFGGVYEGGYDGMVIPDAVPMPGGSLRPGGPSDPFRDDPDAGSPQARNYRLWNMPEPATYRTSRQPASRVTPAGAAAPRPITVHRAEPLRSQANTALPTSAKPARSIIRTTSDESSDLNIPTNPLRN